MSNRLDNNMAMPKGMKEYLNMYGWHFSKAMCEWASSMMYRMSNGSKDYINPYTKPQFEQLLTNWQVNVPKEYIYDALYIANMCKADFLGRSIPDERHLALYVSDVMNDPDAYDGMVFTRFYADCIGSGIPIHWEDLI